MTRHHQQHLTKVAVLGAAGGIGQPLALLLMLQAPEHIQHLALYDLIDSVRGVGTDLSHVDRQCKVTTHLGQEELADAVRGAKVIVVPAGLAQKPGMSRDDLFGSNAKIMYNLAKVCAQTAPDAMLAIITNPVNSLVPIACEVYHKICGSGAATAAAAANKPIDSVKSVGSSNSASASPSASASTSSLKGFKSNSDKHAAGNFDDCYRRIFGVTTLDVIRASTLTARSAFFKTELSGLFKDPTKIKVPVVGGHAGKTIMPILSQATPKLDPKRLCEERATTMTLVESIQQAGIDVLNDKKGKGSATLAMAHAACRFTVSLLRAIKGEQNIVECAYVRQQTPTVGDLDYFATPLQLGKDGYVKSLGVGKVLPFEQHMLDEGARELRASIVKGEDFAKEHHYN